MNWMRQTRLFGITIETQITLILEQEPEAAMTETTIQPQPLLPPQPLLIILLLPVVGVIVVILLVPTVLPTPKLLLLLVAVAEGEEASPEEALEALPLLVVEAVEEVVLPL